MTSCARRNVDDVDFVVYATHSNFFGQANAVQEAIRGLKDGTIDASKEIVIEGLETESAKAEKAAKLAKKKADYLVSRSFVYVFLFISQEPPF
jgi:hypothetical protein